MSLIVPVVVFLRVSRKGVQALASTLTVAVAPAIAYVSFTESALLAYVSLPSASNTGTGI